MPINGVETKAIGTCYGLENEASTCGQWLGTELGGTYIMIHISICMYSRMQARVHTHTQQQQGLGSAKMEFSLPFWDRGTRAFKEIQAITKGLLSPGEVLARHSTL